MADFNAANESSGIDELLAGLDAPDAKDELNLDGSGVKSMLAAHIQTKLRESREIYQLQFLQLYNCMRVMRGIVLTGWTGDGAPEVEGEQQEHLNWPVASAITTNILAVLQDVYGSALSEPFTLAASENPDLPKDVKEWLDDILQRNLAQLQAACAQQGVPVASAVSEFYATAKEQAKQEADDAARQLDAATKTEARRGGWEKEFAGFLYDYVVYPVAIMRGPVEASVPTPEWNPDTGRLEIGKTPRMKVERISPFMFYPAPNAKDVQSSEYIIHIQRYSSVEFSQLETLDGYRADAIRECMINNPHGHVEPYCNGTNIDPTMNPHEWTLGSAPEARGFYDVIQWYGRVSGEALQEAGVAGLKAYEWYEVEAELCGDDIIRIEVKEDGIIDRPFHTACFAPVTGSIYGESVCSKLFNVQRVAEAVIRTMIENMSWSAQPFAEVNIDRIPADQAKQAGLLEPGDVKITTSAMPGDTKPAYTFNQFPSNIDGMQRFMEFVLAQAYEVIGFSKPSLGGNPGTVGRTSSGMSIALNQASKPIKLKINDIGASIVKPIIKRIAYAILEKNPDPTLRGDVNVYPKGMDGVVDNEVQADKILQAAQMFGQMAQMMTTPGPGQQVAWTLFNEWCKISQVPLPSLSGFNMQAAIGQDTGSAYQPAGGQPNPPAPTPPPPDGRAGGAPAAIAASNDIPGTMAR